MHEHIWHKWSENGMWYRKCQCGAKQVNFGYAGSVWHNIKPEAGE